MAEIRRFPFVRHLRAEPSQQILRFRKGQLVASGRGLSFWFQPMNASLAEVPVDDREIPFLVHGRSRDFQEVVVQGTVIFRVRDPNLVAGRVDFTIDLDTGVHRHEPLEKLSALFTELCQQLAMGYLVRTDLATILEGGTDALRELVDDGLRHDEGLAAIGLEVVAVRVGSVRPEADVERALQVRVREAIQQKADEATFQRRALAVEKERAIQENELQNKIELARREEQFIAQRGENERRRITDENDAARIAAEGAAARATIESGARAASIRAVEDARVDAERARMAIYRDFPADRLLGLAAQELAGKLQRIEHLNLTPDLLGTLLTNLVETSTRRLETAKEAG
jgi:regulator of protease activity HflC (stomatin/prohibitin superfamily)